MSSSWPAARLGDLAEINPESLTAATPPDFRFRYIDISAVEQGTVNWGAVRDEILRTAPSRAKRRVRSGDVLFGTVRPALRSHGYVDQDAEDLVASTGFAVIRANSCASSRFLFHFVLSELTATQARRAEVGSNYPAVNESDVRLFAVPNVPLPEQHRIAEILDTLDEAIRKTEQIIEKLKLMKQGLLHDLLTRGIDDNGELRDPDSGRRFATTSLGLLPRSWSVHRISDVAVQVTDGDHHTPERASAGIYLLSARNVLDGRLDLIDVDFVCEREYLRMIRRCHPEPGDVLISCSGTIGRTTLVPPGTKCVLVRSAALVKLDRAVAAPEFVEWAIQSSLVQHQIRAGQRQAAQPNLFQSEIARLLLPLPPRAEQQRIAAVLNASKERIEAERKLVGKLRQIKLAIADDLLTGRVRVQVAEEVPA